MRVDKKSIAMSVYKMSTAEGPLVSVLTPVYNGEAYLAECIESVLAQSYLNWEYAIVNNCSTDGTLEIAERYARLDKRIHVYSNDVLLDLIASHNKAFRLISADSKYCKVVSADDWLFPECLMHMVGLAEANPSVGIVGSYQLRGGGRNWRDWQVRWDEVPYPSTVIPGHEICRSYLLGGPYVFGTPTSTLYRSDLIKGEDNFYPNSSAEADTSACYKCLQRSDFGFVHQVLSYERDEHVRMTTRSRSLNAYIPASVSDLLEYGEKFLSKDERDKRLGQLMRDYYMFLASSAINFRERQFWAYHKERLKTLGYPLSVTRLSKAIFVKLLDLLLNPKRTADLLIRRRQRSSLAELSANWTSKNAS
jgi:glycosyltransferase involved in cell wall biosynthesis